jgi:hypothetical protein
VSLNVAGYEEDIQNELIADSHDNIKPIFLPEEQVAPQIDSQMPTTPERPIAASLVSIPATPGKHSDTRY